MRPGWVAERAFAYNPTDDVARQLPRLEHRDYSSAIHGETVAGTADLLWIEGDAVSVADWKTTVEGAPDVDAHAQLEWLALMAARSYGYDAARVITLKVTEAGVFPSEPIYLDMFQLAEIADRIRRDVAGLEGSEPIPGEHCTGRYCRAVSVCPATSTAMAQLIPDTALVRKEWRYQPIIESPDHLALMLTVRPLLRKAMEQCDAAIEAYVSRGPVLTSDGREIKQHFRNMPRMNQGLLLALAKELGATEEQLALCVKTAQEPNGVRLSAKKGRA
jgi:hypothetical protein